MAGDIEQEFLAFNNHGSIAAARLPPVVGVECRVVRSADANVYDKALHRSTNHAPDPARVIGKGNHDGRADMVSLAPTRQRIALVFGSGDVDRDPFNPTNTQSFELMDRTVSPCFKMESAAHELSIDVVRRLAEDDDPTGDAALDEVGCLQNPGRPGVDREHDDVHRHDGFIYDQGPPDRAEDRSSNEEKGNGGDRNNRECERREAKPTTCSSSQQHSQK